MEWSIDFDLFNRLSSDSRRVECSIHGLISPSSYIVVWNKKLPDVLVTFNYNRTLFLKQYRPKSELCVVFGLGYRVPFFA